MRAWEIGDQPAASTLHPVERSIPKPGPREVLIRVQAVEALRTMQAGTPIGKVVI